MFCCRKCSTNWQSYSSTYSLDQTLLYTYAFVANRIFLHRPGTFSKQTCIKFSNKQVQAKSKSISFNSKSKSAETTWLRVRVHPSVSSPSPNPIPFCSSPSSSPSPAKMDLSPDSSPSPDSSTTTSTSLFRSDDREYTTYKPCHRGLEARDVSSREEVSSLLRGSRRLLYDVARKSRACLEKNELTMPLPDRSAIATHRYTAL